MKSKHLPFIVATANEVAQLDNGQRAANPLIAHINGACRP
jgi:hypothetical protein